MVLSTRVTCTVNRDQVQAFKDGQMVPDTRACGKIIKLTVVASFGMLTVMSTTATGVMTKLMDMAFTLTRTVRSTKDSGLTINNMAKGLSSGPTVATTLVNMRWA